MKIKSIKLSILFILLLCGLNCKIESLSLSKNKSDEYKVTKTKSVNDKSIDSANSQEIASESPLSKNLNENRELINAIKSGNFDKVKELLENGSNPNSTQEISKSTYTTALGLAVDRRNVDIARILLEKGANVNKNTFTVISNLHETYPSLNFRTSVVNQDVPMMKLLFQYNADTEKDDKSTPVLCSSNTKETLDFLIGIGFDINIRNIPYGFTCLMQVIMHDKTVINGHEVNAANYVKAILQHNPDLTLKTEPTQLTGFEEWTALSMAKGRGNIEIIEALENAGAKK